MTTTTMNFRIPTPDSVMAPCRLEFQRNTRRVAIGVDRALTELYRAQFHGPQPNVAESDRSFTIAYPRFSVAGSLRPRSQSAQLTLAAWARWEIHFRRGVSRLRDELADSELCSLQIEGGASDVHLNLPAPRHVVPIHVGGGTDKFTVIRPAEIAVCLPVGRGTHNLQLDKQRFGGVGNELLSTRPEPLTRPAAMRSRSPAAPTTSRSMPPDDVVPPNRSYLTGNRLSARPGLR